MNLLSKQTKKQQQQLQEMIFDIRSLESVVFQIIQDRFCGIRDLWALEHKKTNIFLALIVLI